MDHPRLVFVHFGPPCGTASRARDKPMPKRMLDAGWSTPPKLRSELFPLGLPDLARLHPRQAPRVWAANIIYEFVADVASGLSSRKVLWLLENPDRSYFWWIPAVAELLSKEVSDVR